MKKYIRNNGRSRFYENRRRQKYKLLESVFDNVLRESDDDYDEEEDPYEEFGEEYDPDFDPAPYGTYGGMYDNPSGFEFSKTTLASDEELADRGYEPVGKRTSYHGDHMAPFGADLFKRPDGSTRSRQDLTQMRVGKDNNYDAEIDFENQMLGDTGTGAAPGNIEYALNWEDGNSPGSYGDDGVWRREVNDATDWYDRFGADDPTFESVDYDPFEDKE